MPTPNQVQGGKNQLQRMLEDMYRRNIIATASPEMRPALLHDAGLQAQYDAGNYVPPDEARQRKIDFGAARVPNNIPGLGPLNQGYTPNLTPTRRPIGGPLVDAARQSLAGQRPVGAPGNIDPSTMINRLRQKYNQPAIRSRIPGAL